MGRKIRPGTYRGPKVRKKNERPSPFRLEKGLSGGPAQRTGPVALRGRDVSHVSYQRRSVVPTTTENNVSRGRVHKGVFVASDPGIREGLGLWVPFLYGSMGTLLSVLPDRSVSRHSRLRTHLGTQVTPRCTDLPTGPPERPGKVP